MKLKDLKLGQQFKFTNDKTKYLIISPYPTVIYKSVNGYIEYRPKYSSRINKDVKLLDVTEIPVQISFIDGDGDKTIFNTETEADFIHVLIKTLDGKVAIGALSHSDTIELTTFLQRHLDVKV